MSQRGNMHAGPALHQRRQHGNPQRSEGEARNRSERRSLRILRSRNPGERRYGQRLQQKAQPQPANRKDQQQPYIRGRKLDLRQLPGGKAHQHQPGQQNRARAEAVNDAPTSNRRQHRGDCQRHSEETGLKCAQTAQILQVDGQENDAPEEAERNQRVRDVAGQKRPVGKETQINKRLPTTIGNPKLNEDEQSKQAEAANECDENRWRIPAVGRGIGERIEHGRESSSGQHKSQQVKARPPFGWPLAQEQQRHDDGDDPHWHIDIENQAPVGVGYKVAAQRWPDRRGHQRGNTHDADGQAALVGREFVEEQCNRQWKERRTTDSLHHAEDNQRRQTPGQAAERRSHREEDERDHIETFGIQAIRKVGCRWSDHALSKRIGGENPLEAAEIYGKGFLQSRERVVYYGLVENTHERAKNDDHDYDPLIRYFAALAAGHRNPHGKILLRVHLRVYCAQFLSHGLLAPQALTLHRAT